MAEISGPFVSVDLDVMLCGQRLKFGERRESSQGLRDSERHGGKTKG
jgi:hypothetical protein